MKSYADAIEQDLAWRERELASLKVMVHAQSERPIPYRAGLRSLCTMLYAHYEGFTKFCWETFLDELEARKVTRNDLSKSLKILSLEAHFRKTRGNLSSPALWAALSEDIPKALETHALFPKECRLSTKSNLWPSVFREETEKLGLVCNEIVEHEIRIKTLVSRRNEIAHGEKMEIKSVSEYDQYERSATSVMHGLAVKVIDHLENDRFSGKP